MPSLRLLSTLTLSVHGSALATPPAPPSAPPAPALAVVGAVPPVVVPTTQPAKPEPATQPARRWLYRGKIVGEAEGDDEPSVEMALVETGRRKVSTREVVDLAVEIDGKRADDEMLRDLGVSAAPFPSFSPQWSLVVDREAAGPVVWLVGTSAPDAAEALDRALDDATPWHLGWRMSKRPKAPPADRAYFFRDKVAGHESVCEGFAHPSPDTGDYFESERCFGAGVGITRLMFDSVWGGYKFDLVKAPAEPALPRLEKPSNPR